MNLSEPDRLTLVPYTQTTAAVQNRPTSDRVRVIVVLPNGSKIVIPTSLTSTVSELQTEALRRAIVLRLPFEPEDSVLHIGSINGAIAFEEDLIEDVLDLADDNTLWLSSIQDSLSAISLVSFGHDCCARDTG